MVRYHLGLDGSGSAGKRMRPLLGLLAYASITGDHEPALPGAAAVELGHNFSLVHDDIEDGDVERRHRPTLWALHGIPQAINTGDAALHPEPDRPPPADRPRLQRPQGPAPDAPLRRDLPGPVRGPVHRHLDLEPHDDPMSVELYFDMIGRKTAALISAVDRGRRPAGDRRRGRHRRATGPSAGPWASPSSSTTTCSASGATSRRPARSRRTSPATRRPCRSSTPSSTARPDERDRLTALYAHDDAQPGRGRRGRRDPGTDRRSRLHPRPGPALPRRGARRAGRRRRRAARGPRRARGDHGPGDQRLSARRSPSDRPRRRPSRRQGRAGGPPGPCRPAGRRWSRRSASGRRAGLRRPAGARRRCGGRSARRRCRTRPRPRAGW